MKVVQVTFGSSFQVIPFAPTECVGIRHQSPGFVLRGHLVLVEDVAAPAGGRLLRARCKARRRTETAEKWFECIMRASALRPTETG